jgi:hypothetical protein
MTGINTIRIATAGLIAAGVISPVALASGEPKNEWPFTRPVAVDTSYRVVQGASGSPVGYGEAKNEWPFTRPVAGDTSFRLVRGTSDARAGYGEAKNEQPFNRVVVGPTEIVTSSDGFDWGDASIGVAAGFGLALSLGGGLLLALHRAPRIRKIGAAAAR